MLSTITESTELRPLTADEIDFVAGGSRQSVHAPPNSGVVPIAITGVSGTLSASASGNGEANATVSSSGPGNITVVSSSEVIGSGTASTSVVAYST